MFHGFHRRCGRTCLLHCRWLVWLSCLIGCGESRRNEIPSPVAAPGVAPLLPEVGDDARDLPGVANVCRIADKILSGGLPEKDEGFRTLRELGVRTVISVDGARPEVALARRFGLRYVHLPIGYDGVPREQGLRLARAVRDLPGLVFIHCHHGKHRSPAAAAAALRCLDSRCGVADAVAILRRAGTAPHYRGLYAALQQFQPLTNSELDQVAADFPEVAEVPDLVQWMVTAERHIDRLRAVRAAGWQAPAGKPSLDPAHEALLLREALAEMARLPELQMRPAEWGAAIVAAQERIERLETALRKNTATREVDRASLEAAFLAVEADCAACHAKYRDAALP